MLTRRQFFPFGSVLAAQVPRANQQQENRPNILLITFDQMRWDCFGAAGHPIIKTPNLDRVAREGALFTRAFAQCPQCVPSRTTIHTGRYPHTHRVESNLFELPDTEPTLARLLGRAGYEVLCAGERPFAPRNVMGGFTRSIATGREHGELLRQYGFSAAKKPDGPFQAAPVPWPLEIDENTFFTERVTQYLRQSHHGPFFLHINYRRPHHPFDPPKPYDTLYRGAKFPESPAKRGELDNKPPQQRRALRNTAGFDLSTLTPADLQLVKEYYAGMITLCDDSLGEILKALDETGMSANTLLVVCADHGEMLGDHGLLFKAGYMYEGVVRVPLVIRHPGRIQPNTRIDALVELADLAPTVLESAAIASPGAQGKSLWPLLRRDPNYRHKDAVYSEFADIKMIRTLTHKLVYYPNAAHGELYDLVADSNELSNRYDDPALAGVRRELTHRLLDWRLRTPDPLRTPSKASA